MAAMANNDFGIPCQHKQYDSFALTKICPICRQLNKNNLDQQREPTKNGKKANKKAKIDARKKKKYGNVF